MCVRVCELVLFCEFVGWFNAGDYFLNWALMLVNDYFYWRFGA